VITRFMIEIDRLTKRFGPVTAVDGLSFDGPSRAGDRVPRAERRGKPKPGLWHTSHKVTLPNRP
jgi:hypothetical protein